MDFYTTIFENEIIYTINKTVIDDSLVKKILKTADQNKKTAFDMKNVITVNSSVLIKCLLKNNIKLFNLKSEVLVYLSLILKDGFLKSYMNSFDFRDNKRELIRRHFLVA